MKIQRDFVHGITHEFNTPITNIQLVSQNLIKSKDDKIKKAGHILKEEGGKLQFGINLVLTTALIEKDELFLQKKDVDIKSLIQSLASRNLPSMSESGIDLNVNLSSEDLFTVGDAYHLENVFQNMINNVQKHSGADQLKIETKRVNGHVTVKFIDNGKGVAVEDRKRIFEKFERQKEKGLKNGYGLGLYYSKMILLMHGGNIELEENGQLGSIFSIQLPV